MARQWSAEGVQVYEDSAKQRFLEGVQTDGNQGGAGAIAGDASVTLAGVTGTAAGALLVQGAASATLDGATGSAAGTLPIQGAAGPALAGCGGSAAGTLPLAGTCGSTLAGVTGAAAGALAIAGAGSVTLDGVTGAATGGDAEVLTPGGAFRRALPTWARVWRRGPGTWDRSFERALPTWARVWRYDPMALATEYGPALIAAESDDREYAFDCTGAPELATGTGITIASGEILGGSGLTFGSVSVLAAAFDGIAIGKGLSCRISGGAAGTTYKLACRATLSNGRKLVVPARLVKVADYDS